MKQAHITRIRLTLAALLAVTVACSNPTAPTQPAPAPTPAPAPAPPAVAPAKAWPVDHADGEYGHEDPSYAPAAWQCPASYVPVYNNWNWVCEHANGINREMPRRFGYSEAPQL